VQIIINNKWLENKKVNMLFTSETVRDRGNTSTHNNKI